MAVTTRMTYGTYQLKPVPIITINRTSIDTGNRENPIGYTFSMNLNGTLTKYPNDTGFKDLDTLMEELRAAFNKSGNRLLIECDSGSGFQTLMTIYPRVLSINFAESNNNWTETIPYTIELEYDTDGYDEHPNGDLPPYISEYSEDWQCEFVAEKKYYKWDLSTVVDQKSGYDYTNNDSNNLWEARVTHTVTVRGKPTYGGAGPTGTFTSAADNALNWAKNVFTGFGYDHYLYGAGLSGWTNLQGGTGNAYDYYRTHTINETDGTVTLGENWLVVGDNSGKVSEEFTVEVRESIENGLVSVSINGTIQGLEERSYNTANDTTNVDISAYDNAANRWSVLQDRIFPRAQYVYEQGSFTGNLNPKPTSKSVGHNPGRGTITYAMDFNNRPCAFITGALSESFSINDTNPSDVFARLPVLGRAAGPVLQSVSTITESIREVAIEAVMPPPTGCSSISDLDLNKPSTNVQNLLCEFETNLTNNYQQVFKNSDTESWNPLTGRYSRSVSWTYQSCTGTPNTSMC